MSSKTLELDKLHLTLASEKLKLDIASAVDIRFPSGWSPSLNVDAIVKALTSGHIWVSRGRQCRVDIEVSFNGKPLDRSSRIAILESLGYHLRDAHLWSQLLLSPSLEIPQSSQTAESLTNISIHIQSRSPTTKTKPKAWLLDNIDIKAPECVLHAEFERLRIQMKFNQIQKRSCMVSKRLKTCPSDLEFPESMLLDYIAGLGEDARVTFFESIASILPKDLSNLFSRYFNGFEIKDSCHTLKLLDKKLLPSDDRASIPENDAIPVADAAAVEVSEQRRDQPSPKKIEERLWSWLDAHPGKTSLTNAETVDLLKQTSLRKDQLYGWLNNACWQKKPPSQRLIVTDSIVQFKNALSPSDVPDENYEEDMFVSNLEDGMLFDEKSEQPDDTEMLMSQSTSTTASLTSQSSSISIFSSAPSVKRPATGEIMQSNPTLTLASLPLKPANKLSTLALQTLIAGPSNRKRDLQGIQVRKPHPSTNLSNLVPSMFSPGFKELLAHNSKFLPTISNAVSSAWVRNVQGVTLRQKLVALSSARVSEYYEGDGEQKSVERLAAVVQARLWRMMQRGLYDEGSARKLWRKDEDTETAETKYLNEEEGDVEDLLGANGGAQQIGRKENSFGIYVADEFIDDDDDLFDDLLGGKADDGSDDGLLAYLEERRRSTLEAETEEMLFRSNFDNGGYGENDYDEILLLGGGGVDESLIFLEAGNQEDKVSLVKGGNHDEVMLL